MYEIINEIDLINKNIKMFNLCEAPGQFIKSILYYSKNKNIKVDWKAQSLNPNNKENIKTYGTEIFGDMYGLLKNNPDKWDFGDDTGDVTKNIDYYISKYSNSFDLVTSDCGLPDNIFGVQEDRMLNINYSQFLIAFFILKNNGNYIYKIFLPIINPINIFMIYQIYQNFDELYFYKPYQNPSSSEIYIIGKNYHRPSNEKLNDLKSYYNNYNEQLDQQINKPNESFYQEPYTLNIGLNTILLILFIIGLFTIIYLKKIEK